jgi:hypothetical protein
MKLMGKRNALGFLQGGGDVMPDGRGGGCHGVVGQFAGIKSGPVHHTLLEKIVAAQSAAAVSAQCAVAGCGISVQFLRKAVWIMFTCHFRKSAVWQKGANCDNPVKAASVLLFLKI